FEQLKDMLRREVLDSQFRGMKQALENPDPAAMQRVKDMLGDLNNMLEAGARGEHTQADFDQFMENYGDLFPDQPENLEQLVDSLVRRMAAAERLASSLRNEQAGGLAKPRREDLANLMAQAMEDAGLAREMTRLSDTLHGRRPDIFPGQGEQMMGDQPLGLGEATTALAGLADLAELEQALSQDYPGASLDDIDEDAVRRAFGRQAVDDVEALRRVERELEQQGYLNRNGGKLELTPRAVRRLGETALRRVFPGLTTGRRGDHDRRDAGQAGELTGATRAWKFGDEQPIDTAATIRKALLRQARTNPDARRRDVSRVRLDPGDFEVAETERRGGAAGLPPGDPSYSMALRGTWASAKQTALALHALMRMRFPQDALQVVGFSNYARELQETELGGMGWDRVQCPNVPHALVRAGRPRDRPPEQEPVVLIVTDGEPTAPLQRDGRFWFDWPPSPETLQLTVAEVDKMTRRNALLNIFMLAED